MEMISLAGIITGLLLMIFLTYKGHSIIWVAPICAFVAALFSLGAGLGEERNLLTTYTTDYMKGVGTYFISWFPIFLLGAIYGKIMDKTGVAKSLADVIVKLIGPRFAVLAVLIPCMVLTYGGVSLFVVVFIIYPIGYAIYRSANIPRTLLPAVIAFGSFGITMTSVPGSPQIQNLIPMDYFGTSATAGPVLGLAASLLVFIPGYLYLDWRVRKAKKDGLGFEEAGSFHFEDHKERQTLLPMWLSGLLPLVVVFLTMNILRWNIVISLLAGILVCCILRWRDMIILTSALTEGANGSVMAIMNTACAVGFGSVIRILPGFALLTNLLTGNISSPVSLFFSESMSICALSGATGSASGGLSIVLEAFSSQYLQIAGQLGVSPELLHRFASIAAGSFDKLPHNGAVITLLVVSQCTHKDSYKDIFVVSVIIPMLALFVLIILWGLLI